MNFFIRSKRIIAALLIAILVNTVLGMLFIGQIKGRTEVVNYCTREITVTHTFNVGFKKEYSGYAMWTVTEPSSVGGAFFGDESYRLKDRSFQGFIDELCYGQVGLLGEKVFTFPTFYQKVVFILGVMVLTCILIFILFMLISRIKPNLSGMLLFAVAVLATYIAIIMSLNVEMVECGLACDGMVTTINWWLVIPAIFVIGWLVWLGKKKGGSVIVFVVLLIFIFLELTLPFIFWNHISSEMREEYYTFTGKHSGHF